MPHWQNKVNQVIYDFAAVCPPAQGATKMSQGKPFVYKLVRDQLTGEIRLLRYWHPIGHYVSSVFTLF